MIKICSESDLERITEKTVYDYIRTLLTTIIYANMDLCPNLSIEEIGAIYFAESTEDLHDFQQFGFITPLAENRFEWFTTFGGIYADGCIILDNDRGMNIIAEKKYFIKAGIIDEYYEFD